MSDAASIPDPNAAGPAPASPHTSECGKDSLNRLVERTRHTLSGFRLTVEKCPDASRSRALRGALCFGGAGAAIAFVVKRHPMAALCAGVVGGLAGALASRYHLAFDWDPDRAFGGERRAEVR